MKRSEARESAFILLFEFSFHKDSDVDEILSAAPEIDGLETDDYATALFSGAVSKLDELDERINKHCVKWNIKRITRVALTALRMAFYEIDFEEGLDAPIAVNEAVNLVKKYDTPESASFINGILGAYLKSKECAENI